MVKLERVSYKTMFNQPRLTKDDLDKHLSVLIRLIKCGGLICVYAFREQIDLFIKLTSTKYLSEILLTLLFIFLFIFRIFVNFKFKGGGR